MRIAFPNLLLIAAFAFPSFALAANYQAYEFSLPTLASRADLQDLLSYRSATVSDRALNEVVSFELQGVRWKMDRDVFALLESARRSHRRGSLNPLLARLADEDVTLNRATMSSPAGQIRAMLKPIVTAGVPNAMAPLFDDPELIQSVQLISTSRDGKFPPLTENQKVKFAFIQGALMWRLRGGGLFVKTDGSQTWRYLFTVRPMMTLAEIGGASRSWQIGGEFWAGLLQSWGRYFDIGRFPNQEDRFRDLAEMTRIGSRLGDRVADDLEHRGYDASPLRIAGRQFAGCYDYAWEYLTTQTWGDRSVAPFVEIAAVPTQWAELCVGASFGSALMKTLLRPRARSVNGQ